ncbi:MAG TPA: PTS sugar transporter subunit IIA [Pseudogracilibacillus sp.]|nr:PTS sugar transporter subunit IIA [Pseudogracilibacillus sp.]
MIGFVITGHGTFPEGVLQSVELITGEVAQIKTVTFETDTDKLHDDLDAAMTDVDTGDGVVCFADLAGGTPFNVCSKIAVKKDNVRVIGGTNSPMLLSGVFQRENAVDAFVDAVIQEGKDNIKAFEMKQEKKDISESDSDGV